MIGFSRNDFVRSTSIKLSNGVEVCGGRDLIDFSDAVEPNGRDSVQL